MTTDLPLKIALSGILPSTIEALPSWDIHNVEQLDFFWLYPLVRLVRETEWEELVKMAENNLTSEELSRYVTALWSLGVVEKSQLVTAKWQVRVRALAKVKGVEIAEL